jgi:AraC-like DNA-binding protein
MRKLLLKVTAGPGHSFSVAREDCEAFYGDYHYHPEYELTLILKGEGTRFVGDTIESFSSGDLVLIGADLPHVWKSNVSDNADDTPKINSSSIAVHFAKDFLGSHFFQTPELHLVNELLEWSTRGVQIVGKTKREVAKRLLRMPHQNSTERLITLLDILHRISRSSENRVLSTAHFTTTYLPDDSIRIKNVYQYVITHFKSPMRLQEAAKAANMSPTSFCRYFKQHTRKTFSSFVNEIRVSYACRLLQDEKMKMSAVCYESGFGNLSNFNKQFKNVVRLTPMQYVKTRIGKNA